MEVKSASLANSAFSAGGQQRVSRVSAGGQQQVVLYSRDAL